MYISHIHVSSRSAPLVINNKTSSCHISSLDYTKQIRAQGKYFHLSSCVERIKLYTISTGGEFA